MFNSDELLKIQNVIRNCTLSDKRILDDLVGDVRKIKSSISIIKSRATTAVSLVASDGGNIKLEFDPFYVQLIRVVDSYGKQLCLDAVSPSYDLEELDKAQFNTDGSPKTALGLLMNDLGVSLKGLNALSHMMPNPVKARLNPENVSPSWVLVYRDLCEWASLYELICHHPFPTDTLIVRDGLLRSKLFRGTLFIEMFKRMQDAIDKIKKTNNRTVYLVGIAKHSKVLTRYNLAMAIEGLYKTPDPYYAYIPREIEAKAYVWPEYARGEEAQDGEGEAPKFVMGDMYFVRFGKRSGDPVWCIDILPSQKKDVATVFGYLLADAIEGFPIPLYPRCLQKAHEFAQLGGFDSELLQNSVSDAVREMLPDDKKVILDELTLKLDLTGRRYS